MVKININIQKKDLWLISAIAVFLVGSGIIIAFDSDLSAGTPSIMGHSSGEILVDVPDYGQMSLQAAITAKLLGNGSDGGGMSFGDWQATDSGQVGGTGAALTQDTIYQAITDGMVLADGNDNSLIGYSGSNDPPAERVRDSPYPTGGYWASIGMPVKLGDYWEVEVSNSDRAYNIFWMPIVSGGGDSVCEVIHPFDESEVVPADLDFVVNIPSSCIDNVCQVIMKRLVPGNVLDDMATFNYYQDSGSGKWQLWGTRVVATDGINGDTGSSNMVNLGGGDLFLYDDQSGVEENENQWSLLDRQNSQSIELIVCP